MKYTKESKAKASLRLLVQQLKRSRKQYAAAIADVANVQDFVGISIGLDYVINQLANALTL